MLNFESEGFEFEFEFEFEFAFAFAFALAFACKLGFGLDSKAWDGRQSKRCEPSKTREAAATQRIPDLPQIDNRVGRSASSTFGGGSQAWL